MKFAFYCLNPDSQDSPILPIVNLNFLCLNQNYQNFWNLQNCKIKYY